MIEFERVLKFYVENKYGPSKVMVRTTVRAMEKSLHPIIDTTTRQSRRREVLDYIRKI